jgi:hypothetical protein
MIPLDQGGGGPPVRNLSQKILNRNLQPALQDLFPSQIHRRTDVRYAHLDGPNRTDKKSPQINTDFRGIELNRMIRENP